MRRRIAALACAAALGGLAPAPFAPAALGQTTPVPGAAAPSGSVPSGAAEMAPARPAPPPAAVADKPDPNAAVDLIRDRPKTLGKVWTAARVAVQWTAGVTMSAIEYVAPPSAHDLARENPEQAAHLFKLLGLAGYKLKEIENVVGVIPGLSFKFGMVRELSEADIDYLDEQMDLHRQANSGLFAELQRGIVSSVVAINNGGGMQVSELKLALLPLPKAQFSITPTETALGEEASALMRAIQRVDRRVRDMAHTEIKAAKSDARR
ncbi:hypothetical protein STVA_08660 [Allostella vacuolata]|nr:hypothetical protein STVA_08660 [Stella vacuolata]